ncbi:hypothetical protein GSI_07911 [Ganoderma sinense ZZ0214-1]|uniref:F-box domain-containing protein n=1 Tax=Ganoderma sinense ZZ0214-1 TaxID=1077348 RepID=A0A2G8S893_9APHY|nr:hypothetical protein GSI_07911 [Ganoderma sinense ZZ0214-1]
MLTAHRRFAPLTCAVVGHGKHTGCLLNHSSPHFNTVLSHYHSPITRLSNEELLLVFEAALDSVFATGNVTAFRHLQHPDILVTISHVCRRWRAIAISNSGLWKNISSCSLSVIERYLSRSGTRPLNVYERFPSPSRKDASAAIADALAEKAYRWKTLLWVDRSANNATNVARLLQSQNAYPALERLELSILRCVPVKAGADNASNTILFPALQHLSLTRVHPMVLPRSAMPSLLTLKLDGLARKLLFSRLLYHLSGAPALRTLILHDTLPTVDPHRLATMGVSPPTLFPNGTIRVSEGTRKVKLPALHSLSLRPAPPWALWLLFHYLELPALTKLDLHIYTDRHSQHWPWISPDGRPVEVTLPPSDDVLGPDHWAIPLPALRTLHITYYVSPPSPPSTSPQGPDAPPPATATLPQLRRLAFPGLTELQIALASDPRVPATSTSSSTPPRAGPPISPSVLPPLPAFDALLHAPDFRHLVRLALVGCVLPLTPLSDALRGRMPALEVLALRACRGAGPLVCALAPGECRGPGGCERSTGDKDGDGDGDGGAGGDGETGGAGSWIGMNVSVVIVSKCADVRAGCLRRVIEARVRASAVSVSASGSGSELKSTSTGNGTLPGSSEPGVPVAGGGLATGVGTRTRPQRITQMQVLECPGVTKGDAAALAGIPGAPAVYWRPPKLAG